MPMKCLLLGTSRCRSCNLTDPSSLFYLSIFLEREKENRESMSEGERENLKQAPCSAWNPMWGSIPWPWDHDLSWNQELDTQPTESTRRCDRPKFLTAHRSGLTAIILSLPRRMLWLLSYKLFALPLGISVPHVLFHSAVAGGPGFCNRVESPCPCSSRGWRCSHYVPGSSFFQIFLF